MSSRHTRSRASGSAHGRQSSQTTYDPITGQTKSYLVEEASAAGYGSNFYTPDSHVTGSHHYDTPGSTRYGHDSRTQAQGQIFRSAQASKQMVYEVFGNAIAMLEEMESREMAKQSRTTALARSDIHLHSQAEHDDSTVQRKVDTQLLLLQSQLESCDREIRDEVKDDLKVKTLDWLSQRQAHKVKKGKTDTYAGKLFEVLAKGKTKHPEEFYKTPTISERDMQRSIGAYMKGTQRRSDLDTSFRNDPSRQAVAPRVRAGAGLNLGVDRMMEERPDLKSAMGHYRTSDLK